MRTSFLRNPWIITGIVLATGGLSIAGAIPAILLFHGQQIDLSSKPPAQVFARIFKMPLPEGITNMKVAGESHLSGTFWMRFKADAIDAVLTSLKRNSQLDVKGPTTYPHRSYPLQHSLKNSDAAKVSWSDALKIKKPEYYEFSTKPLGTGWAGMLVVDRKQNTIYAQGELL